MTNYGRTQTDAASLRRRATQLHGHLGGYVGELDLPANDVTPCLTVCVHDPLPTTNDYRAAATQPRGRTWAPLSQTRTATRQRRSLAGCLARGLDRVFGHGSPSVHLAPRTLVEKAREGTERHPETTARGNGTRAGAGPGGRTAAPTAGRTTGRDGGDGEDPGGRARREGQQRTGRGGL